jgi:hypothetical protein
MNHLHMGGLASTTYAVKIVSGKKTLCGKND